MPVLLRDRNRPLDNSKLSRIPRSQSYKLEQQHDSNFLRQEGTVDFLSFVYRYFKHGNYTTMSICSIMQ